MKGKEAYRFYQQNNVTTQNIEQILTTAYSLLKTEMEKNAPDAEHVIHALNTKYGKGRALFHSPELKKKYFPISKLMTFSHKGLEPTDSAFKGRALAEHSHIHLKQQSMEIVGKAQLLHY